MYCLFVLCIFCVLLCIFMLFYYYYIVIFIVCFVLRITCVDLYIVCVVLCIVCVDCVVLYVVHVYCTTTTGVNLIAVNKYIVSYQYGGKSIPRFGDVRLGTTGKPTDVRSCFFGL